MKTKIVYIITSSLNDIYWEEGWVSVWSARYHNPEAHIVLVSDKETLDVAEGSFRKKSLELFDEKITVDYDDGITQKQRSRWIKTNLRKYVRGDFLYIDTDTVITDKLDEVDDWNYDLGMVYDGHFPHKMTPISVQHYEKAYKQTPPNNVSYYNSGVIFAKENEKTSQFFQQWHDNWRKLGDIIQYTDQTPLLRTVIEHGNPITEISGIYNCQALFPNKYLYRAKIMHFFHLGQYTFSAISPFMRKTTFQRIKDAQGIDKDFQQMIINCKAEIEETSVPVNEDVLRFLESTIIQFLLFPFYLKKRSFFLRADKLLHSICRVLYRMYIRLKSLF
jgi:hypothetical protein